MQNHTSNTNHFIESRMLRIIVLTVIFTVTLIGVAHYAYDMVLFVQNVHLPATPPQQ